jgi:hypothetical protein
MGVLEIVILSLLALLLSSTGWLIRIFQILVGVSIKFGRSLLTNFFVDQIKQPDTEKKSRRALSQKGKESRSRTLLS